MDYASSDPPQRELAASAGQATLREKVLSPPTDRIAAATLASTWKRGLTRIVRITQRAVPAIGV